ncbi:alpha/beta fold hydrolase [Jatrophihabitans telluris]|uniref:Alpha/beta fold hydrolase n=1 Tax=Jatrophihabitans telluris TaxID=2038343 RepID=A0ABY4QW10_9ACTN|nr:alpha/beta fold hydrolase [Jatrophihabitans telluris]UQX87231.1 alpha/beta fold hydrolase [Jatrophihabitans telluris]
MPLLSGAEPFSADGPGTTGRVGVLVSHGFTGTPASMRPWAEHLAEAGYTVRLPRLPGHGTRWQDLNDTKWTDWYGEISRAYAELSERCDAVFACGLSMGATLVTKLAEDHGSAIAGLVLVNPAYGTLRKDAAFARYLTWAVKSRPGIGSDIKKVGEREPGYDRTPLKAFVSLQALWKIVVADLGKVSAPIRFYHSSEDHVVDDLSGRLLRAGATATTVEEITLADSYHVATMDNDAETIFAGSVDFIRQHTAASIED